MIQLIHFLGPFILDIHLCPSMLFVLSSLQSSFPQGSDQDITQEVMKTGISREKSIFLLASPLSMSVPLPPYLSNCNCAKNVVCHVKRQVVGVEKENRTCVLSACILNKTLKIVSFALQSPLSYYCTSLTRF